MCGITGYWARANVDADGDTLVRSMAATIAHRGPDDAGTFVDRSVGIALGHRRLSIVDLSPLGHQPMVSPSGRYVIVYNGEVYNYQPLRDELEAGGHAHGPGTSDTATMLAAIDAWGLEAAVKRFDGMFAFALWDQVEHVLHLVRDRVGIKPLYWAVTSAGVVFGSELKSLCAFPAFRRNLSAAAVSDYFRFAYVPSPQTIWEDARKLAPATIATFRTSTDASPLLRRFWSAEAVAWGGADNPFAGDVREATDELDRLLRDAVRLRMIADVPLGAFLSGGVDSSTVVAMMQAQSPRPIRTFSVGFEDRAYDESRQAERVASYLGTDHTTLCMTSRDIVDAVPRLPQMYDEPFADSSQLPTYLVSKLAREFVTVALSGDGGDELFGGYNRHVWGPRLWKGLQGVPRGIRRLAGHAIDGVSAGRWDGLAASFGGPFAPRNAGLKLHKLAGVLEVESAEDMYRALCQQWPQPPVRVAQGGQAHHASWRVPGDDFRHWMMMGDLLTYLPDDVLVKVDRASMAVALEARVPLLDHRVIELAWSFPTSLTVRRGTSKWILRQVLDRYLPRALYDRPKMGFGGPLATWLRGPLREWSEGLLDARRLERGGIIDSAVVRPHWDALVAGEGSHEYAVWTVLMFQAWGEAYGVT